jgi:hypothetical protein
VDEFEERMPQYFFGYVGTSCSLGEAETTARLEPFTGANGTYDSSTEEQTKWK